MTKAIDIVQRAVGLANVKMAKRLKTCECKMPYRWLDPQINLDGRIRVELEREGWNFYGYYACFPKGNPYPDTRQELHDMKEMIMMWVDDGGCNSQIYGPVTVEFVLKNLLEFVLKQLLGLQLPEEE